MRTIVTCILILSISSASSQPYATELQQWYKQRDEYVKSDSGWLNLIGLYWIKEGRNSFGSSKDNDIAFDSQKVDPKAGFMIRNGNRVYLQVFKPVMIKSSPSTSALVYDPDSTNNPLVASGDLRWKIIKRDDKLGIRLRDLKSAAVQAFKGIKHFPIDTGLIVKARFEPHTVPTSVPITNVLGQTYRQFSPGTVSFALGGKSYNFLALEEDGKLFIVFGDATNDKETYSAGRFILADEPAGPGTTILDFNKAYNPPCAFTEFATCPLPPKQNIMQIPIRAGEKNYKLK